MTKINQQALDVLFDEARTYNEWQDRSIDDAVLKQLYDLTKMAPTAANCQPLRVVFVKSDAAKAKLKPLLAEGNVEKTMSAPVCAILAMDGEFYEHLPELFPHVDAKSWYAGNDTLIEETAFRNSSLQAGYFILAARALGLDCGPMSGFDNTKLDEVFFAGTKVKSNMLCNLGYGVADSLHPRSPRPEFSKFCEIV